MVKSDVPGVLRRHIEGIEIIYIVRKREIFAVSIGCLTMVKSLNVNELREQGAQCPLLRMSPGLLDEITEMMESDGYKLGACVFDYRHSLIKLYFMRGDDLVEIKIADREVSQ